jgi:hypothetical protein
MMTGLVNGVLAISVMMPDLVRKKFKLPVIRPIIKPIPGDFAFAMYFLQKDHISINITQ